MKLTNNQQEVRRKKLKQLYQEKGITECELRFTSDKDHVGFRCWIDSALGFAHRDKRVKYVRRPLDLWTFQETILACNYCHYRIENDKLLTLSVFRKLRP